MRNRRSISFGFDIKTIALVDGAVIIVLITLVLTLLSIDNMRYKIKRMESIQIPSKRIVIPNEVQGRVFFDLGSAEIRSDFMPVLKEVLNQVTAGLKNGQFDSVVIEGHTDGVPVLNSSFYRDNWDLGAARAATVMRYLIRGGVPVNRISIQSFADSRPIDSPSTGDSQPRNRRIEVVLLAIQFRRSEK